MKTLLVILMVAAITACSPKIKEGEVVAKEFTPQHTMMILMPVTVSTGKTTITNMIPMLFFFPDSYRIDIRKFEGGEWIEASWWTDRATYDQVVVGGYFIADEECWDEQPKQRASEP